MSTSGQKRTRSERVAALELPPNRWARVLAQLRRRDVLVRLGLCVVAALVLCGVIRGWDPPFPYRVGGAPSHDASEDDAAPPAAPDESARETERPAVHFEAGRILEPEEAGVLWSEYEDGLARRTVTERSARATAFVLIVLALFGLCGLHLYHTERRLITNTKRLAVMLALVTATVALARWAALGPWRAEIIPLLLFGQTVTIAYRREVALLFAGVVTLVLVVGVGYGLGPLLIWMGTAA
ncbi:MAG: hypothetical protein ACYTG0_32095, partial [Planctomycetota bacterium]